MPAEMFEVAADMIANNKSDHGPHRRRDPPRSGRTAAILELRSRSRTLLALPSRPWPTPISPQLLNLRTFPTLMGYSSRILAESWESNLLYYAAMADELHIPPSQLNVLIPEWTQQTVERIFATHLEDWPALLRSLRLVGDEVRQKTRQAGAAAAAATGPQ